MVLPRSMIKITQCLFNLSAFQVSIIQPICDVIAADRFTFRAHSLRYSDVDHWHFPTTTSDKSSMSKRRSALTNLVKRPIDSERRTMPWRYSRQLRLAHEVSCCCWRCYGLRTVSKLHHRIRPCMLRFDCVQQ